MAGTDEILGLINKFMNCCAGANVMLWSGNSQATQAPENNGKA